MIIPVRCFTCGKVLADKYLHYKNKVRQLKIDQKTDEEKVIYLTPEYIQKSSKTPEGIVMDELKLTNICCRRHLLTHVDID
tara:strand:- start:118 stop:360 length:243 start_codon:yes stop_codon:yes gene_type:complete